MKILLIAKSFSKGGAASGASNLARALKVSGAEVICLDAYERQGFTMLGSLRFVERVIERVLYNAEVHCVRFGPAVFNLQTLYRQYFPDIIQLCDVSGNVIRFADIAKLPCPVVHRMSDFWPYHGPAHYATAPSARFTCARWFLSKMVFDGKYMPDMRIAPSQWLADHITDSDDTYGPLRVIKNSVTIPSLQHSRPLVVGTLRFGFISNAILEPRKGFQTLPPLLNALAASGARVSLHLFGNLPKAKCLSIRGVEVVEHGSFTRDELARVFDSFDVLLCPSRFDNSPNVLTEALAHARPVIAQCGTGMDSYVDSDTGFLMDFYGAQSTDSFIEACKLLANQYISFSSKAAQYALENLSYARIGSEYLALYEELLND